MTGFGAKVTGVSGPMGMEVGGCACYEQTFEMKRVQIVAIRWYVVARGSMILRLPCPGFFS
jgi:hypothetical protein